MKIVILSGQMGVGKDYIADQMISQLQSHEQVIKMAFADPLRDELNKIIKLIKNKCSAYKMANILQVDVSEVIHVIKIFHQDPYFDSDDYSIYLRPLAYRDVLQYWGTDVRRKQDKDYWVKRIIIRLTKYERQNRYDTVILTDARFRNEITDIQKSFERVYAVRLIADEQSREQRVAFRDVSAPTKQEMHHISETAINDDDECFDMRLKSDGHNGEKLAKEILNKINKGSIHK